MRSLEAAPGRMAAVVWAGLAAVACAGGVVPQDSFYRLEGLGRPDPLPAPALGGVLVVQRPSAGPLLGSRPILWREDRPGAPLAQYHYHHWAEVPPVALQRELVACLRAARVAPLVVTPRERAPADFELAGRIERLEHLRGTGRAAGRVLLALELSLRRVRDPALLHLARYRAEEPVQGDLEAVARAFTRAVDRLCAELVADLAALRPEAGGGPPSGGSPPRAEADR